jgi:hypothetical protein
MPSHAYFEQAVAAIIHFKRDQELLNANPIKPVEIPNLSLKVIALDDIYANQLLQVLHGGPIPDLKSQDLIYFCIARQQALTLLTEDRRLRNVARRGGLNAYHVDEALSLLNKAT